jgi:2-polyprenyl-6-methoxyphenol hydroxylase-like FAD-dependent oxidoreductase
MDFPVLIVGAGPVGLALAGDLGWHGQRCLVVEQGDGAIFQPKMDLVGVRTMEFCRRWGLVPEVEATPYPRDWPQDVVYLTGLAGWELEREFLPTMDGERAPPESPQHRERCPQNMFDPVLRRFAERQPGVELRYRTRLVGFVDEGDSVVAELEDVVGGRRKVVRAAYLVGCDGAGSTVRERLSIAMDGAGVLTYTTNVIFRCDDLLGPSGKAPGYRFVFIGPQGTWATIVAINGRDQWRMSLIGSGERREYNETEIRDTIQRLVGRKLHYEILSVMPWIRRELVAGSYGRGRVWLAGDSVHCLSPTGAFGMNTGIQDAVDLSWKLDAMLRGWGGEGLLESYTVERRPVAQRNVREASANLGRMLSVTKNPLLLEEGPEGERVRAQVGAQIKQAMKNEWNTLGIHLGYRYRESPVCWPDGTVVPADDPARVEQTTHAGSRAPHVWLRDGRSTLDLFGRGFVLLRLGDVSAETLVQAASVRGVPMELVDLNEPDVVTVYARKLVLVRPCGHVAWRGDAAPDDAGLLMDCVRGAAPFAWQKSAWQEREARQ